MCGSNRLGFLEVGREVGSTEHRLGCSSFFLPGMTLTSPGASLEK